MRLRRSLAHGFTIVEMVMTSSLLGAVGLALFSMLNTGMVLGAKNTAVNTAHQNARTAMLQMIADLHSAVSLPYLIDDPANVDAKGNPIPAVASPAAGITFQLYALGPLQVVGDVATTSKQVNVAFPLGDNRAPVLGQLLIVPTHKIEDSITAITTVTPPSANIRGVYRLTLTSNIANAIQGTGGANPYNIACFITDRCSYTVIAGALDWKGPGARSKFAVLGSGITNPKPFSTPTTAAGAYDYKFIAAIDLSTSDSNYSNRGFKSANILLNGKVPTRARLTTYQ
jgi:hypothetical protein